MKGPVRKRGLLPTVVIGIDGIGGKCLVEMARRARQLFQTGPLEFLYAGKDTQEDGATKIQTFSDSLLQGEYESEVVNGIGTMDSESWTSKALTGFFCNEIQEAFRRLTRAHVSGGVDLYEPSYPIAGSVEAIVVLDCGGECFTSEYELLCRSFKALFSNCPVRGNTIILAFLPRASEVTEDCLKKLRGIAMTLQDNGRYVNCVIAVHEWNAANLYLTADERLSLGSELISLLVFDMLPDHVLRRFYPILRGGTDGPSLLVGAGLCLRSLDIESVARTMAQEVCRKAANKLLAVTENGDEEASPDPPDAATKNILEDTASQIEKCEYSLARFRLIVERILEVLMEKQHEKILVRRRHLRRETLRILGD